VDRYGRCASVSHSTFCRWPMNAVSCAVFCCRWRGLGSSKALWCRHSRAMSVSFSWSLLCGNTVVTVMRHTCCSFPVACHNSFPGINIVLFGLCSLQTSSLEGECDLEFVCCCCCCCCYCFCCVLFPRSVASTARAVFVPIRVSLSLSLS
jgi:hypothetical protein